MNARIAAASVTHEIASPMATALLAKGPCEDCRAGAAQCQEIATYRPDLLERQYEELAHQWLLLAEQAERSCGYVSG